MQDYHTQVADNLKHEAERLRALVPWRDEDSKTPTCPCCGSQVYPKETAEYRAWATAQADLDKAIRDAVLAGEIGLGDAAVRWDAVGVGSLALSIKHERERRERSGVNATTEER